MAIQAWPHAGRAHPVAVPVSPRAAERLCRAAAGRCYTDEQCVDAYAMRWPRTCSVFDWVFDAAGKLGVLQLRVLVCCRHPDELPHFHLLHHYGAEHGHAASHSVLLRQTEQRGVNPRAQATAAVRGSSSVMPHLIPSCAREQAGYRYRMIPGHGVQFLGGSVARGCSLRPPWPRRFERVPPRPSPLSCWLTIVLLIPHQLQLSSSHSFRSLPAAAGSAQHRSRSC